MGWYGPTSAWKSKSPPSCRHEQLPATRGISTDGEPQRVWRPATVTRRTELAVTLREAAPTSRAMVVAVMVSMVAFLDSTVINLALPATEHDLGAA